MAGSSFSDAVNGVLSDTFNLSGDFLDYIVQYVDQNKLPTKTLRVGGVSTQTPGAVTAVTIAHGLGGTPTWYFVQPAGVNAAAASGYYLTADETNVTLNFSSVLTAATSYSWVWAAEIINP